MGWLVSLFIAFLVGSLVFGQDPDLEPGFPVQAYHGAGSYHAGPAIHTLVGNIDEDPTLEIVVTGLATGPLYAWNSDGSLVPGWPVYGASGAGYPTMGNLSNAFPGLEVFSGHFASRGKLIAYSGSGSILPGWPRWSANFVATPAALVDIDGDGLDEIFVEEEDWKLHAYRADGSVLPGWPPEGFFGGQERHTPAFGDLDGEGDLEIVVASGWISDRGVWLFAYHHDGRLVAGFPRTFMNGRVDTFPAIGDVDGDGALEIVVVAERIYVLSADGTTERSMAYTGSVPYGSAPALADLDGDSIPEIVVQTDVALNVWYGDGRVFPGWPVVWGNDYWLGESSPVVGDVDGDRLPDIVVTTQVAGSATTGLVRVYNRNGVPHPHFPKTLAIGGGAVPAIADLDSRWS